MQIIEPHTLNNLPACVATVGFFDGVHSGHRFLIEELKQLAVQKGLASVIVTFASHPRKVLNADFQPELLTLLPEKLTLLNETGVDYCVVLDFTKELAQLSAYEFLKQVLQQQLNVHSLLVGHDHRFGHNRTEDFTDYQRHGNTLGIELIKAQQFSTANDHHISSSRIRQTIKSGEVEKAARMLSYPYRFYGEVIEGFKMGRKIGFPTANINSSGSEKVIPANGVYAVKAHIGGKAYKAMMNIGIRPTLDNGHHISLEVHLFDFSQNIYHQQLTVEFMERIRNEQRFQSLEELTAQLEKDKQTVLKIIF